MATPTKNQAKTVPVNPRRAMLFSFPFKTKCIFLCAIGVLFYGNSLFNKYAMDDQLTILDNTYVQMGFSGIPKILSNDSYASYYVSMGGDPKQQLSGGRFRPLSEIVFAIEQQLLGGSDLLPFFRHFVNIVAFACCLWAMFYFLDKFLFKKIPWGHDMAFIATFLFAIHPLHTEVVANIKSLDEILSILFILLTFIFSLNYLKGKQVKHLIIGVVSYFLALLSKEYAVTLIFFIPLLFYLLEDTKILPALKASIPYYGIFAVYIFLRYKAVGFHSPPPSANVLTNPYYFATHLQKIATEWFVLGKYLRLLFWPYPLSADYSYYQIKYHSLTDITVLLSILVYLAVTAWGVILLLRRNILSFAIFFFLFNIILISNFVTDIGATMGERLAFHSSFGLVIILAYYAVKLISQEKSDTTTVAIQNKKNILIGAMSLIGVVCLGETVVRNAQWKDDTSLFIHDVSVVPDSFLANSNAGGGYLKLAERKENTVPQAQAYLDSVRKYSLRALKFFPNLDAAYNKLGGVCLHLGQLDSAEYYWDLAEKNHPNYIPLRTNYVLLSHMFFQKGLELGKTGQPQQAVIYMRKALLHDSTNANIWYNMGGAYFTIQRYDSAKYAWMKTLQYQPDNADAKRGLAAMGVQQQ